MALATALCRESLARSARIHFSSAATNGALFKRRAARRSSIERPLISRSISKIASIFLTASKAIGEIGPAFLPRCALRRCRRARKAYAGYPHSKMGVIVSAGGSLSKRSWRRLRVGLQDPGEFCKCRHECLPAGRVRRNRPLRTDAVPLAHVDRDRLLRTGADVAPREGTS